MTIHPDYTIIPSRNKIASAKLLADLLGVSWTETGVGPFSPVFVNDGLTLDFIDTDEDFLIYHFCFRVGQDEFDSILARIKAAGIKYRSTVRAPDDMQIDPQFGNTHWNELDGHQSEMPTVSYARPPRL